MLADSRSMWPLWAMSRKASSDSASRAVMCANSARAWAAWSAQTLFSVLPSWSQAHSLLDSS